MGVLLYVIGIKVLGASLELDQDASVSLLPGTKIGSHENHHVELDGRYSLVKRMV
ncbi:hypothetical protein [Flagellimonas myxillae]|uniref:hypothetical protein n=1 Tax=Flagellimonas myxillae TaxID=2942214 RepID=UPI00201FA862|nr:hypothetical protein [Muricauda myxillae]MCL6265056.1 hypothetical protein [Muricauda myxillae]